MFDAVTLSAVVAELNEKILHGRVQDIVALDALTFGMEIYAQHVRQYLLISLDARDARVHLVTSKLRGSGEAPSSMLLLLRKYVEGAYVDAIEQLPHERVARLRFDHATEGQVDLVIETIGKYSNLILVDAGGTVVDALRRVPGSVNRARITLPSQPYVPPPPQAKMDPSLLTAAKLERELEEVRQDDNVLWKVLVRVIAGVSPLLAREIAFRVEGQTNAGIQPNHAESIIQGLSELAHAPWHPTVALDEQEPAEYAPYLLTQFENSKAFESISEAIEAFYGAPESYAAAKEPLRVQICEGRDKLARKRDALAHSLPDPTALERLRTNGELVLAYAYSVQPGQTTLRAETEEGIVEIPLESKLTAVENAQKLFKEYHRSKDAAARVPALLAAANADLEYAEQMLNDLELAENRAEIDAVIQAARDAGLVTQARPRAKVMPSGPRVVQSEDGFTILVGKNARQNDEITFRRAQPDDLWLHVRNVAGAHVVIASAGRAVPESTVERAAELAAYYSQARGELHVDVIVVPRKNVRRPRGAKPGLVTVRGERTVQVSGRKPI